MNELIKVTYDNDRITVLARDLHEFLGLTERFSTWFERMLQYGFIKDTDFTSVKTFTVVNNGAKKELNDYQLTLEMAKEISMIQRNEKGKQARRYFIECEKALKENHVRVDMNQDKALLAQAKVMNAKSRIASIWLKIGDRVPNNSTYQQICNSYASEALTGEKVLPLPECYERYYSATEIAKMVGSNHVTVGKKAKAAGIRPLDENGKSEYGKWFFDKSPNSNKQVTTFKYNEKGVAALKALFTEQMA